MFQTICLLTLLHTPRMNDGNFLNRPRFRGLVEVVEARVDEPGRLIVGSTSK